MANMPFLRCAHVFFSLSIGTSIVLRPVPVSFFVWSDSNIVPIDMQLMSQE